MTDEGALVAMHIFSAGLACIRPDYQEQHHDWLRTGLAQATARGWLVKFEYINDGQGIAVQLSKAGDEALAEWRSRMGLAEPPPGEYWTPEEDDDPSEAWKKT